MPLERTSNGSPGRTPSAEGSQTGGGVDGFEESRLRAMLFQSEKLAALGQVVAGVAHEINNPLMAITGSAELLLRHPELPDRARKSLERIMKESVRCGNLVRNLLAFAREHEPVWGPVKLHDVLQEALGLLAYRLRATNVRVIEEYLPDLPVVHGDVHQLQQVFLNLIVNAQQALEGQTERTLRIATRRIAWTDGASPAEQPAVQVTLSDTGPGIQPALLSRIFEPFFTTKEPGKGTGLGLSVSHGIVAAHRGRLYVESDEGKGSRFFVELPAGGDHTQPQAVQGRL